MYSVVLMMALSGGADATDLGHRNKGGCVGAAPVASCCAAPAPVYTGGCLGAAPVSNCCPAPAATCQGGRVGLFARLCHKRTNNNSCCGAVQVATCAPCAPVAPVGCIGGVVAPTPVAPPKEMPKEKKKETIPPPKENKTPTSATLVVTLPADAVLTVDGYVTTSTTGTRVLVTPVLATGSEFTYNLTASVVRDGQTVTQTQRIAVRAGEQQQVPFNFASSNQAVSR